MKLIHGLTVEREPPRPGPAKTALAEANGRMIDSFRSLRGTDLLAPGWVDAGSGRGQPMSYARRVLKFWLPYGLVHLYWKYAPQRVAPSRGARAPTSRGQGASGGREPT